MLDAGPLGLLCRTSRAAIVLSCHRWANDLVTAGHEVIIPEIADYEVRRELIRLNHVNSVTVLDTLSQHMRYMPLSTSIMRRAAVLWALARQQGQPTAGDNTIDADMILVAQAESLKVPDTVIATTNVSHLSRCFPAELWLNITP